MSKDNQITGYPSNDLYAQFMMKKDLMGLSQSAAVSLAIDCWVKQDVYNKAEDLVRPTEDKLDQMWEKFGQSEEMQGIEQRITQIETLKKMYEEAVAELEQIVNRMENNELDIDSMSEQLKRAQQLIKLCKDKLTKTDEEIQKLLKEGK